MQGVAPQNAAIVPGKRKRRPGTHGNRTEFGDGS